MAAIADSPGDAGRGTPARGGREAAADRLAAMLEGLPDGLFTLDPMGCFTYVNERAASLIGRSPAELAGRFAWDVFPAPMGAVFEAAVLRVLDDGVATRLEAFSPALRRRLDVHVYPCAEGLVVFVHDAPEREGTGARDGRDRPAEDPRTAEAARARDRVAASVAHDLANPLTTMQIALGHLRRDLTTPGAPSPEMEECLESIDRALSTMWGLVHDLVDVAQLREDRMLHLDRRPVDLVALARRLVRDFAPRTGRHTLRVVAGEPALVGRWDPLRLERVVATLLDNAIKYSPRGGEIAVTVSRQVDGGRGWAALTVRDAGIGIPPADRPRLFTWFFRAGNAKAAFPGAGLGLAGAKQIVVQHGGSLTVESREGIGSAFTIRLPLPDATPGP